MIFCIGSTFSKSPGSAFSEGPSPGPGPGSLYKVCLIKVAYTNNLSDPFTLMHGVRQGCPQVHFHCCCMLLQVKRLPFPLMPIKGSKEY